MIHDVVEVDANTEAMSYFHHLEQLGLGTVAGAHRVALIFATKVERIP